jgi:chorismate mutase
MTTLEKYRKKIDKIDKKILKLISQRFKIMPRIPNEKSRKELSKTYKAREVDMIMDRVDMLKKQGYKDFKFVESLFKTIIKKSKEIQKKANKSV